ncbi:glycosyltransferase [Demequina zhanjiangensis]|uniref:Glycosyltransferase n=1 Tax=Demequina zhanjiangensis TaxID=3051659 RepID=A0ABT8G3T6_9MICO|nr:glycosyltransferase [Demequina sp. SYSU T00b26]MDN4473790.1 glycosyltransferase [Demequina sp. SYSU T00b26]
MRIPGSRTMRRALNSITGAPQPVSPQATRHQQIKAAKARKAAARAAEINEFWELIAHGAGVDEAAAQFARKAVGGSNRLADRSFLLALASDDSSRPAGQIGMGIFLLGDDLSVAALEYFEAAGAERAIRHAAPEYFEALCRSDREAGIKGMEKYLEEHREQLSAEQRFDALKVLGRHRDLDALEREVATLPADFGDSLDDDGKQQLRVIRRMLAHRSAAPEAVPGAVSIGVMEYKMLDAKASSSNRGDYVQTLAAISHLLRFRDVDFVGDSPLAGYLTSLQDKVHEDRVITDTAAKVLPVAINRDFASGAVYPENTWFISNGWFMHRSFKGELDFPYPSTVNPLFVSFHIQNVDVLTPEVVANLKENGPIGCRDWTTVYRLRDHGVPCFFSGCVTTTVGQVLDPAAPSGENKVAWVEPKGDLPQYAHSTKVEFAQVRDDLIEMDLVDCIEDARQMLNEYASFDKVVTSRLHCYLPARSMGLDVDFRPRNQADVRFEGLLDLNKEDFQAIRGGLEAKLEAVYRAILAGQSRDEVYALWRELTAEDVAFAEKYATSDLAPVETSIDVPGVAEQLRGAARTWGPELAKNAVDIAFATDENLRNELPVVLDSVMANTKRPVRCHILTRGLDEGYGEMLSALFPEVQVVVYACDDVDYGSSLKLLSHTTVSTLDRILLPEILVDRERVVYLDIDILVTGDVATLFDLDLGDSVMAGKPSKMLGWSSMAKPVTRSSLALPADEAYRLRRTMHATASLGATTVNAGVLLLHLARMREEGFARFGLGVVEKCAMNDQDALNLYAGGRILPISDDWNHVPAQEFCGPKAPSLIHWAGPVKAWGEYFMPYKELFSAGRERVLASAATVSAKYPYDEA